MAQGGLGARSRARRRGPEEAVPATLERLPAESRSRARARVDPDAATLKRILMGDEGQKPLGVYGPGRGKTRPATATEPRNRVGGGDD